MQDTLPALDNRDNHCDAEAMSSLADRDYRIDVFRGLALWWIFVDHIPETYLNHITPKNFGFSDAAEILVFLSGLASGSVYGAVAGQFGLAAASLRALRRALQIYVAQIVTIAALLIEVGLLANWQPDWLHHANVAVFFSKPGETALHALTLRYSPVNLDPLLLMVILHFALVAILPAMIRWPNTTLIASAMLYFVSHWLDWSIPAYPSGVIYFNPLDWQLLFVMAMWWGTKRVSAQPAFLAILKSPAIGALAAIYVLFSLFITLGWHFHSLEDYVPETVVSMIYPIDKGNLDILRLLHFLAVALLVWRLLPCDLPILRTRLLRPLAQCGAYSLVIYCLSVLLAFAAHAVLSGFWNDLASQTLVSVAGLVILSTTAAVCASLDENRGIRLRVF